MARQRKLGSSEFMLITGKDLKGKENYEFSRSLSFLRSMAS